MGDDTEDHEAQAGDNPAAERAGIYDTPDAEKAEEIDAERRERLDPANRPEKAEIDNSDAELPTVDAWYAEHEDDPDMEGNAGSSDPSAAFRDIHPSEEEVAQIEEERQQRLDPANRPDNAEVDNTQRTFEDGQFVD